MKLTRTTSKAFYLRDGETKISITRDVHIRTAIIDGRPYDIDYSGIVYDSLERTWDGHRYFYPYAPEEVVNTINRAYEEIEG